jgi:hypothetical protein
MTSLSLIWAPLVNFLDPFEAGQVGGLAFLREDQLGCGIPVSG